MMCNHTDGNFRIAISDYLPFSLLWLVQVSYGLSVVAILTVCLFYIRIQFLLFSIVSGENPLRLAWTLPYSFKVVCIAKFYPVSVSWSKMYKMPKVRLVEYRIVSLNTETAWTVYQRLFSTIILTGYSCRTSISICSAEGRGSICDGVYVHWSSLFQSSSLSEYMSFSTWYPYLLASYCSFSAICSLWLQPKIASLTNCAPHSGYRGHCVSCSLGTFWE